MCWFNPPWSNIVETNIGQNFLKLVDKHFPDGSRLKKFFNRNTIKISYCCLGNMGSIISGHNKKILNQEKNNTLSENNSCNCHGEDKTYPVEKNCLQKSVVYEASVKTATGTKKYIGSAETSFKQRWYSHNSSFRHKHKQNETTLSKHIWELKEDNKDFEIKWQILKNVPSYNKETKKCQLCLVNRA